jgi:two-component system, OmpR family, response regulator
MHRILVIEDDPDGGTVLALGLTESGYEPECVSRLCEGLALLEQSTFDALLVDRMLPDGDGLGIIPALRERGIEAPIIFLTALGEIDDRIAGLRAGGDDYIVKPFSFLELLARLEVVLRRNKAAPQAVLRVGDLEMNLIAGTVKRGATSLALQPREFRLLEFLMRHANQTVTRSMLLEGVWKYHIEPGTKILDVQMSRLRQKIDREGKPPLIHTVRGAGYCIREN